MLAKKNLLLAKKNLFLAKKNLLLAKKNLLLAKKNLFLAKKNPPAPASLGGYIMMKYGFGTMNKNVLAMKN